MNKTKIEYADYTWNPVTGCTKISEGCRNCFAQRIHQRFHGGDFSVKFHEDRLREPLSIRKPSTILVCDMGDLFHDDVTLRQIEEVFNVMSCATADCGKGGRHEHEDECWCGPPHTFLVLTKRPERMAKIILEEMPRDVGEFWPGDSALSVGMEFWPPDNIYLGISVENQATADLRLPVLYGLSAAGWETWVSYEPALGPVDFSPRIKQINWIVCGGESGQRARPMSGGWPRIVRDQCAAAGVPFYFKSWGRYLGDKEYDLLDGIRHKEKPCGLTPKTNQEEL